LPVLIFPYGFEREFAVPRPSKFAHLQQDAIEMRRRSRLGSTEISRKLGVPLTTVHYWLRNDPLTEDERRAVIRKSPRYVAPRKALRHDRGLPCEMAPGLTSSQKGLIGEAAVLFRLALRGLNPAKPVTDGDVVDLYVRRGQRVAFLQVRMASELGTGLPKISLRRNRNGKVVLFSPGDFHFLIGYCLSNDAAYVFSHDEVTHLVNSVSVRDDAYEAWWKIDEWLEREANSYPEMARHRRARHSKR